MQSSPRSPVNVCMVLTVALVTVLLLAQGSSAAGTEAGNHKTRSISSVPSANSSFGETKGYFAIIGDWGHRNSLQRRIGLSMGAQRNDMGKPLDFVVSVGDQFYMHGVESVMDPLFESVFQASFSSGQLSRCKWYGCLGNHDYRGNVSAQLLYSDVDPLKRWSFPARYYAIQFAVSKDGDLYESYIGTNTEELGNAVPLTIVVLDTISMTLNRTPVKFKAIDEVSQFPENVWKRAKATVRVKYKRDEGVRRQLKWLSDVLEKLNSQWVIVVGHYPMLSGGEKGSCVDVHVMLHSLLERHGVDAYISGHDHVLQHLANGTMDHFVSGAGSLKGHVRVSKVFTRFAKDGVGYLSVELEDGLGTFAFHDPTGKTIYSATLHRKQKHSPKNNEISSPAT